MEYINMISKGGNLSMSVKTTLEKEILDEIELISKLDVGSKEHKDATEALERLLKQYNEMDKLELEYQDRYESRTESSRLKEQELEQTKKDAKLKSGIAIGSGILSAGVTIWGICKSLKFEEEGVYRSPISRGFIQKIIPSTKRVN